MKFEGAERISLGKLLRKLLSPKIKTVNKRFIPAVDSEDAANTSSSSRQLEIVFNYMDENGDEKISTAELRRCIRMVGSESSVEEEEAVRFSDFDEDGFFGLELVPGSGGGRGQERGGYQE